MGDTRMLVAGGLYDQPLEWFRIKYAGYVNALLKRISAPGYDSVKDTTLTAGDRETIKAIEKAQQEVRHS